MVVLIIDSSDESPAIASFLHRHGHLALMTDTVKSGEGILKKEIPGMVLLCLDDNAAQSMDFLESVQQLDSPLPVVVTTRKADLDHAVNAMKRGAHDFWIKPVIPEKLLKTIEWIEARRTPPPPPEIFSGSIISQNAAMLKIKAVAKRIAASNATVFIQGESGTGKEMFARYIHVNSDRASKPFVALNCAALPETLLESELFGHEKGAFTGAIRMKEGKFELAHGGTLLLDEVTEIPVHLQAKLLRVLQENEVDRLGGKHPVPVDVRVMATTNLAIEESLRDGRFRKDLYYRLNVIPLKIPPLRERPDDIALLAEHFTAKFAGTRAGKPLRLSADAVRALGAYPWPGNVRELQNVVQRAVLLSNGMEIEPEDLIFDSDETASEDAIPGMMPLMPLSEMERHMIHKALESVDGNRTRAADILGISVRTLRNKLNEYRRTEGI